MTAVASHDPELTAAFDFELPLELIAQRPAARGSSRLLQLRADGRIEHRQFAELPGLLRPNDLLVGNDTRVLAARLVGRRVADDRQIGGAIELLLIEPKDDCTWWALARPGRRAKAGTRLLFTADGEPSALEAEVAERHGDRFCVRFAEPVEPALERFGRVPLPPYIRRQDDRRDRVDYQTIFATVPGAIAAPTAGLHFTAEAVQQLAANDVGLTTITLHVGPGTFRPVTVERAREHVMDAERYRISAAAAAAIRATSEQGGRVVAIGTTVVRALEAAISDPARASASYGATDLFIRPGYRFRVVDALITNFHLPRSTLLMLVCAFAGRRRALAGYREAVDRRYRFYSYGDAMLVDRPEGGPAAARMR